MPTKALCKFLRLSSNAQCCQYLLLTGPFFCAWIPSGSLSVIAGGHSLLLPCCSLHVFAEDPSNAISSCIRPRSVLCTWRWRSGRLSPRCLALEFAV